MVSYLLATNTMLDHKVADDDATPDQTAATAQTVTQDDADDHAGPGGTTSDETPPRSIAKDDVFHLLQNARRRAVLRYILAHPEQDQFSMRDVAEAVAAWEHDTTVRQLASQQRQRVYIALYQSHLPKLDDHGVIDYNQSRGVVEPTDLIAVCEPFLEDGLHADTQALHLDDVGEPAPTDTDNAGNFTTAVSSLFAR